MTDDSMLDKAAQGWSFGRPGVTLGRRRLTQGSRRQAMLRPRAGREQPWGQEEQQQGRHSPTGIAAGKPGPTATKEMLEKSEAVRFSDQETDGRLNTLYSTCKENILFQDFFFKSYHSGT